MNAANDTTYREPLVIFIAKILFMGGYFFYGKTLSIGKVWGPAQLRALIGAQHMLCAASCWAGNIMA